MINENDSARASGFADVADYLADKILRGENRQENIRKLHKIKWPIIEKLAHYAGERWHLSADQIDELASESWTKALSNLVEGKYTPKGRMDSWLFSIVHNTTLNQIKKIGKRKDSEIALEGISESVLATRERTPDLILDDQEFRAIFHLALKTLSIKQQAVVLLRLEGCSHAEIAETLHITKTSSRKLWSRALSSIRTLIDPEYRVERITEQTFNIEEILKQALNNDIETSAETSTKETELLPDVEYPITLEYSDKPAIRLKARVRSIKEGKATISIPDDEWDTFYFED